MMAVAIQLVGTWPHFQPALTLHSLLLFSILALMANVCYCAAYLADLSIQEFSIRTAWKRWRWGVWAVGTLFAFVLANYWIGDEIYPAFH